MFFEGILGTVMLRRTFLLGILASCLLATPSASWAAADGAVLRTQQRENTFVVPPGTTRTLTISVVRTDGTAIPDVNVVFSAPEFGPSGVFPMSSDSDQRTLRLQTDSSGLAEAAFTTGPDEGVFLVSGRLEGSVAVATFAFTNIAEAPAAVTAPTDVKTAVQDAIRNNNEIIGLSAVIHGPVLLPAGSVVSSATPEIPGAYVEPFVLAQDSWLLWVDDEPIADFGHATRIFSIPASAGANELLSSAETRSVRWWPTVRLPGRTDANALLPPQPAALEAPEDAVGALSVERAAPSDACAIIIHGPNMPQAQNDIVNYRNYLLRNDLVDRTRILHNLARVDGKLRYSPTSRNEFDRLVKAAAQMGCKKVYLMFAAHGVEPELGGGLLLKSDTDPSKNHILTFEEYGAILQQLGNIQVCVLQISCYAGGLVPALQGRGFGGSVITASSAAEPAYHDGEGHFFLRAFIAAKEMTAAGGDDGKVSDQEALDYVRQNDRSPYTFPNGLMVDRIQTAMPQGSTIQATGTRSFTSQLVFVSGPGAAGNLVVNRPLGAPADQPFTVTIQIAQTSIATAQQAVVLAPGWPSISVPVGGVDCGLTNYTLTGTIGNQTYQTTNQIQVGHFKPSTSKVTVTQGNEVEVKLTLFGPRMVPSDRRATPDADFSISSADGTIAAPDMSSVSRAAGSNEVSFKVKGLMPGKTTFNVFLLQQRAQKTIEVEVLAPDQRQSMNLQEPYDREVLWAVAEVFNPRRHPISLPDRFKGTVENRPGFALAGAGLPFVGVSGNVDPATGQFTATGNSGNATIAGFSNVPAKAVGRIGAPMAALKDGSLTLGWRKPPATRAPLSRCATRSETACFRADRSSGTSSARSRERAASRRTSPRE